MNLKNRRTLLWIGLSIAGVLVLGVIVVLVGLVPRAGSASVQSYGGGVGGAAYPASEPGVFYDDMAVEEMAAAEAPMPFDAEGDFAGTDGSATNRAVSVDSADLNTALAQGEEAQTQERLIIRNGSISIQADDTLDAMAQVEAMVNEMAGDGAFIVNRQQYGGGTEVNPSINLNIRIPVERFDEVMERVGALAAEGTTPSQSDYAQDVTAEYVDLAARLESLEAARERLLELMQNAPTTEELLMAEQQLTQREAEIEGLKGQVQYLSESARLSSINIDIQPYILSQPVDTRWRPAESVRRAVDRFLYGIRDLADGVITFLIAVLPFLLFWGAIIYGIVRFVMWRLRIRREKKAAREAVAEDNS